MSYPLNIVQSFLFDAFPLYLFRLLCILERSKGRRKNVSALQGRLRVLRLAQSDDAYRQQLETHLSTLIQQGHITFWHEQQITVAHARM